MSEATGILSSLGRVVRKPRDPKCRALTEAQARLGFIILSALTAAKGALPSTHDDEMYFWLVSYQHGFTRRALIGTILAPFVEAMTRHELGILFRLMVLVAFLLILSFTWRWLMALRGPLSAKTVYILGALFVTSPFLGLIAYHVGYPDGLVALVVIAGAWALRNARIWTLALVIIAAALIHELALLLLMPLSAWGAINCRSWTPRHYLMLSLIGLACCLTVIFEGQASPEIIDSLTKRLEALSVPQKSAAFQVYASLTQGVWETFSMMRQVCANDLWNVVLETLYAALPGAMILSLALPNLRRSVEEKSWLLRSSKYALFLASGLGPVFLLALAFDTSRLASFSTLTALLTIGLLPSRQEHPDQESVRFMSAYKLAIVAYLAFPILDLHPWNAQALNIRRVSVICSPCAAMGLGFGDYINRRRTPEERASFDSNVDYGN